MQIKPPPGPTLVRLLRSISVQGSRNMRKE
jgi:hypothetical protein